MSVKAVVTEQLEFSADGMLARAVPLSQFPWLKHGCTMRTFSPPDANRAHELQHLRRYLELPDETPILHAEQKHTAHVALFKPEDLEHLTHDHRHVYRQTDGIACAEAGQMLAILTADCAPIFIVNAKTRAIALVHAGWKGTAGRIAEHAVDVLIKSGSKVEELVTWIGPMIGGCCYEVSPEMITHFREQFADASGAGVEFANGRQLDLVALNAFQLQRAGVPADNVHSSNVCTLHAKGQFYSYRGDAGTTGRIISTMYATPQQ